MSFLKRLSYYLSGFSVGIVLLIFFLSGKATRCTYTPDARVINDFSKKEWVFSTPTNDSIDRSQFLKGGDIVFSKSQVGIDSCNVYRLRLPHAVYDVQNCDSIAYFKVH
tara:strand:- start:192 stop:518 length:327 start_codon:yes stop_codon:yes gene_type:complete